MIQKLFPAILLSLFFNFMGSEVTAENRFAKSDTVISLQNPISVEYLKQHLRKESPRLILTPEIEKELKDKLATDPQMQAYFKYLKEEAARVMQKPLIEYKKTGRRLLSVSRDFVWRMTTLSMVYRIEKNPVILKRIDDELKAICSFKDWNPSHYLDVAEASFGVAIAVDWVGVDLPPETVKMAIDALINKGIQPGFMESATFIELTTAPSGDFFNYSDCGLKRGKSISVLLSWFAANTGDGLFFDDNFFDNLSSAGRFAAAGMVWLSEYNNKKSSTLPLAWYGDGSNPVVIFRAKKDDPRQFYLAAKGGKANINHGNMDAGTFIFELDGVRWVIDPGSQNYNKLEQAGFNLWVRCQECDRWELLTKSNKGHSTLTVDDARHNVDGFASVTEFKAGKNAEVVFDMPEVFEGHLKSAFRKFKKESNHSLLIEDAIVLEDTTKTVTWALMTTAEVKTTSGGAVLIQDGKKRNLTILSPGNAVVTVVSLDPPPMELDKKIEGLKRIEINCPASMFQNGEGVIKVRLKGE